MYLHEYTSEHSDETHDIEDEHEPHDDCMGSPTSPWLYGRYTVLHYTELEHTRNTIMQDCSAQEVKDHTENIQAYNIQWYKRSHV